MDFVEFMLMARKNSKKTIAVLSEDYFSSDHCMTEYKDAYAADPSGRLRLLVPMRVTNCTPTLLQTWVYSDLFGKSEADARYAILEAFGTNPGARDNAVDRPCVEERRKPGACPPFPGEVESRLGIEEDPLIPRPIEDQQFKILMRRLLNSFILLFSLGTVSVSVAYLLGSKQFQDTPEHAYWDRMFNFMGDPQKRSSFGFGPGYMIEVFRMMILLIISLLVMPAFTFKEVACRLMLESPARRLLGFGGRGGQPAGETPLDVWVGFLVFSFLCFSCFATVGGHVLIEGPQELWTTEGSRAERPIEASDRLGANSNPPNGPDVGTDRRQPPPKIQDPEYRWRCFYPYLVYSVYSLINYVIGANIVVTISVFAVITDLLWMYRWTSEFKTSCAQGVVAPEILHRRYRSLFLPRLKEVLERYYALLVFLLTGFSFKVWFDRINLSPSAYEMEFYALYVATIPLFASFLLSASFYNGALESAASRAQNPDAFRHMHRIRAFYGDSFNRSIYRPIALVLLASIVIFLLARLAGLGFVL